jgi:3-methyladenine DNA glycosylase AlkC
VEQMSMSMSALLRNAYPALDFHSHDIDAIPFIARFRAIGVLIFRAYGAGAHARCRCLESDTARGWLAMALAADDGLEIEELVELLLPYARDGHFAVREWAWLAARPRVVIEPVRALTALALCGQSKNPYERRFAVELTRPRSVWGQHVPLLKRQPELADRLLDPLCCEAHPYVRVSIANWVRDASWTRPDWARRWVVRLSARCDCSATRALVRRTSRLLGSDDASPADSDP